MMMLPPVAAADPIAFGVGRALRFAIPRLRAAIMASRAATNSTTGATNISRMLEWTPEQWTAAQDAAIARGDMAEAQRLRDLHFKVSAPESKIQNKVQHASEESFNAFDTNRWKYGAVGEGNYFGTTPPTERPIKRDFYIKQERPLVIDDVQRESMFEDVMTTPQDVKNMGYDGVLVDYGKTPFSDFEMVEYNPNRIKLADAVTYSDNGIRIPLGKRDNFNMNDIRYALPFVLPSSKLSVKDEVDDTQLNN
jgi:hypothetical protein